MGERFPIGEYLRDELEARGWTTADAAALMGDEPEVNELVLEFMLAAIDSPEDSAIRRCTLNRGTAERLEKAFGASADFWLELDKRGRGDCRTVESDD